MKLSKEIPNVVYSYLQYHWFPITLTVNTGVENSSIKYRAFKDGIPIINKVILGRINQTVSNWGWLVRPLKKEDLLIRKTIEVKTITTINKIRKKFSINTSIKTTLLMKNEKK